MSFVEELSSSDDDARGAVISGAGAAGEEEEEEDGTSHQETVLTAEDAVEKQAVVGQLKDEGNGLFGQGLFEAAIARYTAGIEAVWHEPEMPEKSEEERGDSSEEEGEEEGDQKGEAESSDGDSDEVESELLDELEKQELEAEARRRDGDGKDNVSSKMAAGSDLTPEEDDRDSRDAPPVEQIAGEGAQPKNADDPEGFAARDTSGTEDRLTKLTTQSIPKDLHVTVAPLFCNRAACHARLGAWRRAVDDAVCAFALDPTYVKALLRSAQAREEIGQLRAALADYEKCLQLDPNLAVAREATRRLPPLVRDQEEKDKAEMMGKLKDLGNSFLGMFGLNTDNFQFEKDPNTGGYSVNFNK